MATVTFFVGLAGSGKSHHSDALWCRTGAIEFEGLLGEKPSEDMPRLIQTLQSGRACSVEEIQFCLPETREEFTRYLSCIASVEWVFFENDLEKANWNALHRKNKGSADNHRRINETWSPHYVIPDNVTPIPIYRIRCEHAVCCA